MIISFLLNLYVRKQYPIDIILDVAHNPDAIKRLVMNVKRDYRDTPIRIILALSRDKDLQHCIMPLVDLVNGNHNAIFCTSAEQKRSAPAEQLQRLVYEQSYSYIKLHPSPISAKLLSETSQDIDSSISSTFDRALRSLKVEVDERNTKQMTRQSKGAILICGSGYIMADIKKLVYNYY